MSMRTTCGDWYSMVSSEYANRKKMLNLAIYYRRNQQQLERIHNNSGRIHAETSKTSPMSRCRVIRGKSEK